MGERGVRCAGCPEWRVQEFNREKPALRVEEEIRRSRDFTR